MSNAEAVPSLKDFNKWSVKIAECWYALGTELAVPGDRLTNIDINTQLYRTHETRAFQMLKTWGEQGGASYRKMADALRELDKVGLANSICPPVEDDSHTDARKAFSWTRKMPDISYPHMAFSIVLVVLCGFFLNILVAQSNDPRGEITKAEPEPNTCDKLDCQETDKRTIPSIKGMDRLSDKKLDDISRQISNCWQSVGTQLGVDQEVITRIRVDNIQFPEQSQKAMQMLLKWCKRGSCDRKDLERAMKYGRTQDPTLPKSSLPPKVPHFTGRDKECTDIIDHLTKRDTKFVSVWGSPGFGKTSVATAVGHQLDSQGYVVLFVSLRKVKTVNEAAKQILLVSQQSDMLENQHIPPTDQVVRWLSLVSSPLFIFIDNTDDLLETEKDNFFLFLQKIFQSCKSTKLLCTTRASVIMSTEYWFETFSIRILPLDESSSRNLVRAYLPNVTDDECEKISRICGYVPLAIKLFASVISHGPLSLTDFLHEVTSASSNKSLLEVYDLQLPDLSENLKMSKLFEHCFRNLSPDEQEAFVSLSVFIESFDIDAAVAVLHKENLASSGLLGVLKRKALIEHDTARKSYWIHPLLQSFGAIIGRNSMQTIYKDAHLRLSSFYLEILKKRNQQLSTEKTLPGYEEFSRSQKNVLQVLEQTLSMQLKQQGEHLDTAKSLHNIGVTLSSLGDYQNAVNYLKQALAMRQKLLGEHVDTAWSLHAIGVILDIFDGQNALKYLKQALVMRQKLLGEHVDTALSLDCVGSTLHRLGDYKEALKSQKEALKMRERLLGEHEETAMTLLSIGVTQHSSGDYHNAIRSVKQAFLMQEKLLVEHHTEGDSQNALKYLKQSLAKRQRLLMERLLKVMLLNSIGTTQHSLRDYDNAQKSIKEALAMLEAVKCGQGNAFTCD